jgi:hypothetical protein
MDRLEAFDLGMLYWFGWWHRPWLDWLALLTRLGSLGIPARPVDLAGFVEAAHQLGVDSVGVHPTSVNEHSASPPGGNPEHVSDPLMQDALTALLVALVALPQAEDGGNSKGGDTHGERIHGRHPAKGEAWPPGAEHDFRTVRPVGAE